MRIIFDMDGVIADNVGLCLKLYNRDYDDNLTVNDILDYDIALPVKPECGDRIYDYWNNKGHFLNIRPYWDALLAIKSLKAKGHEIFLATKTPLATYTFMDKINWVRMWIPEVDDDHVIFIRKKGILKADVLIDDYCKNFDGFEGHCFLWDQPYNQDVVRFPWGKDGPELVRFNNWREVLNAIEKLSRGEGKDVAYSVSTVYLQEKLRTMGGLRGQERKMAGNG